MDTKRALNLALTAAAATALLAACSSVKPAADPAPAGGVQDAQTPSSETKPAPEKPAADKGWRAELPEGKFADLHVAHAPKSRLTVAVATGKTSGALLGIEAGSGKILWQRKTEGERKPWECKAGQEKIWCLEFETVRVGESIEPEIRATTLYALEPKTGAPKRAYRSEYPPDTEWAASDSGALLAFPEGLLLAGENGHKNLGQYAVSGAKNGQVHALKTVGGQGQGKAGALVDTSTGKLTKLKAPGFNKHHYPEFFTTREGDFVLVDDGAQADSRPGRIVLSSGAQAWKITPPAAVGQRIQIPGPVALRAAENLSFDQLGKLPKTGDIIYPTTGAPFIYRDGAETAKLGDSTVNIAQTAAQARKQAGPQWEEIGRSIIIAGKNPIVALHYNDPGAATQTRATHYEILGETGQPVASVPAKRRYTLLAGKTGVYAWNSSEVAWAETAPALAELLAR